MKFSPSTCLSIGFAALVASAPAAEIIADFTVDTPNERIAAFDPDGLPNLTSSSWTSSSTNVDDPLMFRYDISSFEVGVADELIVTVDTEDNTANFNAAAGNGIAVVGGALDAHWDPSDPDLSFTVVVEDASGNDITSTLDIDLTGVAVRWVQGASMLFAGESASRTATNEGINLTTGQTSETFFTASRTGSVSLVQVQQLRFTIALATSPSIATTNPLDDATGAAVGDDIVATFDRDIALTGSGRVTIRDLGPGADVVITLPDARVTLSGSRDLVIDPGADLIAGNPYAVQISNDALVDQATTPSAFAGILDDSTWNFNTRPFPPVGPNVIVYLLDDLGLTDVQEHPTYFPDGSPLFETPNMHRLASEGMNFRNAYAQPLCSASRASLLSGQDMAARDSLFLAIVHASKPNPSLPSLSGGTRAYNYPTDLDHLPLAVETIAERLKAIGYSTWHAGKWHLAPKANGSNPNPITNFYPDQQGFDKQLGVGGSGPPSFFGPFGGIPNMVDYNGNPAVGATGDHLPEHMAGLVQDLIDDHLANDPARPFFLYYPAYSVHGPHEAKQSLFNYYQTKLAGLPDSKHQHPVMAAQVHSADDELGMMLDYLDTKGLNDNTLLIFLSDNGGLSSTLQSGFVFDDIGADGIADDDPANTVDGTYAKTDSGIAATTRMSEMAPRRAGKGALYEGGVRIPMIVRYPDGGIAAASSSSEAVHLYDIYQTILDYTPAVAQVGYPLDGVSLKPVLEQTGSLPDRDIFLHFPRSNTTWGTSFIANNYPGTEDEPFDIFPGGTAVINYPYKMIARYSIAHDAATESYELYRLDLDQGEDLDVAAEFPTVVDAMRKRLENYYTATGALVPSPNPSYNGFSLDSPEITAADYFSAAGLQVGTPDAFLLADPDLDSRRNEEEFLKQSDPNVPDSGVATAWLYDNGNFDELRFALPANVDQTSFEILDANGSVAFTPASGLELDAQYGPFFVYRLSSPQASQVPTDYQIGLTRPTPSAPTTPDSDGDALPDDFETANGLNPSVPTDGNTDNDGDGFTRGEEFLAGPDDFDPNDRPTIEINLSTVSSPTLEFPVKDQKAYRLFRSSDLNGWNLWEDFGIISGDAQTTLPFSADSEQEFFKLEAYLP